MQIFGIIVLMSVSLASVGVERRPGSTFPLLLSLLGANNNPGSISGHRNNFMSILDDQKRLIITIDMSEAQKKIHNLSKNFLPKLRAEYFALIVPEISYQIFAWKSKLLASLISPVSPCKRSEMVWNFDDDTRVLLSSLWHWQVQIALHENLLEAYTQISILYDRSINTSVSLEKAKSMRDELVRAHWAQKRCFEWVVQVRYYFWDLPIRFSMFESRPLNPSDIPLTAQ